MKTMLILIVNVLFFYEALPAQDITLIAEGTGKDLYIMHTVSPKENFYSIGRLYNVSPKEIAPYNNLTLVNGLSLGQIIKVPLNQNNFLQSTNADQNSMTPVYHIIEPKEGLYHVSTTYNKVSTDLLKKWNNLQTDVVSNGTKIIIGYLKVQKGSLSAPQTININADKVVKANEVSETSSTPANIENVKKPDEKKFSVEETKALVKADEPEVKEVPKPKAEAVFNKSAIDFKGGMFKKLYNDQVSKKIETIESGISGVFKSTSGWQDGKYYCFHNTAAPGTIMKITSLSTGKSIYAKVLDLIPDIEQNEGLVLHISNSAAEELKVGENRFNCSISYAK